MIDDEPWFRRFFGFSFVPIIWKGWAAIACFMLLEGLLFRVSKQAASESLLWWAFATFGFAIFLVFWAFVIKKSEAR